MEAIKQLPKRMALELPIALILGGAPVFLAWVFAGLSGLEESISDFAPKGFPLWFVVGLSAFGLVFLIITAVFPPSQRPGFFRKVASEIYKEVRSVLRIGAGIVLMFSLIWAGSDPSSLHLGFLWFLLLAAIALAESALLSYIFDWVDERNGLAP